MSGQGYTAGTSHVTKWTFTEEHLKQMITSANAECVNRVKARNPDFRPLNPEEEQVYLDFVVHQGMNGLLKRVDERYRFSYPTRFTAVSLFRRFFAKHSVNEWNPFTIFGSAAFVAVKLEENYWFSYSLFEQGEDAKLHKGFLEMELQFIEGIGFSLNVIHPEPALLHLTKIFTALYPTLKYEVREVFDEARQFAIPVAGSQFGTLFTPSQLSLGLFLHFANQKTGMAAVLREFVENTLLPQFQKMSPANPPTCDAIMQNMQRMSRAVASINASPIITGPVGAVEVQLADFVGRVKPIYKAMGRCLGGGACSVIVDETVKARVELEMKLKEQHRLAKEAADQAFKLSAEAANGTSGEPAKRANAA